MLLDTVFLEKNDNTAIHRVVLNACKVLWPMQKIYDKLELILSDQAQYMVKAIRELKGQFLMFPNLSHISCLAHASNLVAKKIEETNKDVNLYLVYCKKNIS